MEHYKVILISALAAITLAGCNHNPAKETLVPVPVLVKIGKPDRPTLISDSVTSEEQRVKAATIDLPVMRKYVEDLERLIESHDKTEPVLPDGIYVK